MAKIDFSLVGGAEKSKSSDNGWHRMLEAHDLMREAVAKMSMGLATTSLSREDLAKLEGIISSLSKAYEDSTELLPWLFEKMKAE